MVLLETELYLENMYSQKKLTGLPELMRKSKIYLQQSQHCVAHHSPFANCQEEILFNEDMTKVDHEIFLKRYHLYSPLFPQISPCRSKLFYLLLGSFMWREAKTVQEYSIKNDSKNASSITFIFTRPRTFSLLRLMVNLDRISFIRWTFLTFSLKGFRHFPSCYLFIWKVHISDRPDTCQIPP